MAGTFKDRLQAKYRLLIRTGQIVLLVVAAFTAIYFGIFLFNSSDLGLSPIVKIIVGLPTFLFFSLGIWSLSNPRAGLLVGFIFLVLFTIFSVFGLNIVSILMYGVGANVVWKGREAAKELAKMEGGEERDDILDSGAF